MVRKKWDWERVLKMSHDAGCKLITTMDKDLKINNNTKMTWLCKCGRETFTRKVSSFNQGQINCYKCVKEIQGSYNKHSYEYIKDYIENEGYTLLSKEYINSHTKLKLKCKHGHVFKMTFSMFNQGQRCPECVKNRLSKLYSKGKNQYQKELDEIHNGNIIIIGEYINNKTKTKHKCRVCDSVWYTYPTTLLRGYGCRTCGKSKGEKKIQDYLNCHNINYSDEYSFENLVSDLGNPLRYDFAIFDNNELSHLIEYDGRFHFQKIYGNHDLERQKKHDGLKNDYAKSKGIPLIRIPYTHYDEIELILNKHLS